MYLECVTALLMYGDPCVTVTQPYMSLCAYRTHAISAGRSTPPRSRSVNGSSMRRLRRGIANVQAAFAEALPTSKPARASAFHVCPLSFRTSVRACSASDSKSPGTSDRKFPPCRSGCQLELGLSEGFTEIGWRLIDSLCLSIQ
jgi:hypothetical protein